MSDLEYDVLDELYFLTHFNELSKATGLDDEDLKPIMIKLLKKDWLRCYNKPEEELSDQQDIDLELKFRNYYYLASKEGLKAHTSTSTQ